MLLKSDTGHQYEFANNQEEVTEAEIRMDVIESDENIFDKIEDFNAEFDIEDPDCDNEESRTGSKDNSESDELTPADISNFPSFFSLPNNKMTGIYTTRFSPMISILSRTKTRKSSSENCTELN